MHTVPQTPEGMQTKVTVVDARSGRVLEQHVYDSQGNLIASAVTKSHRVDPLSGVTVPRVVEIRCPRAELDLRVDLGNLEVNRPLAATSDAFSMPRYDGYPAVDLCQPRPYRQPAAPPPGRMSRRGSPLVR